jgi:hypothetical protein
MLADVDLVEAGLIQYKARFVPSGYDRLVEVQGITVEGITLPGDEGGFFIPAILAVDAMSVEPYKAQHGEEKMRYVFVYYLQPIDHNLPSMVLAIEAAEKGNCTDETKDMLAYLSLVCRANGFLVVSVSADGDLGYNCFLDPNRNPSYLNIELPLSLEEVVDRMSWSDLFITDFLHFLKCLRSRMAKHVLAFSARSLARGCETAVTHEKLNELLGLGYALTKQKGTAQLKDSLALQVFTLENLLILLKGRCMDAALFMLPPVFWRTAIQSRNITMGARFQLLSVAYDVVWNCWTWFQTNREFTFPELNKAGPSFPFRDCDMLKFMVSLVSLGRILKLNIPDTDLSRPATANLEHLFGWLRLGTGFDSHLARLLKQLVKGQLCAELAHDFDIATGKRRNHNIAGVIIQGDEGMIELPEMPADIGLNFLSAITGGDDLAIDNRHYQELTDWIDALCMVVDHQVGRNSTILGGIMALWRTEMAQRA